MSAACKLRGLFAHPGIVRIIGAHNALGARLGERAGFDGIWAGGLEISTSYGVPDANILSMSEHLATAESMSDAVEIPVVVDCDTGWGNSNNVIHMARKFEAAGVAAVCIEDKQFPKVNSFIPGRQELAPISEFVGKIMAAKNAQRHRDFMVIARVEALIAGCGLEEALKRAHAYARAGADAILIHSKSRSPEPIAAFARQWQSEVPLVVVPTTYYDITAAELEALGVKMIIYANHGLRSAIRAMYETFVEIVSKGSTASVESKIAPLELVFELQGMPQLKRNEEMYLRSGDSRVRAVILGAGDHLDEHSIKDIASDIPMSMLDMIGKPLLQRQVEALNQAGAADVTLVAGYKSDQVKVDGVKLLVNSSWEETGIAQSLLCVEDRYDGRTIMAFGDVLFDQDLVRKVLKSEADITIVVDRTYNSRSTTNGKQLDLVVVSNPWPQSRRMLCAETRNTVAKIGKNVKPDEAHCEFVGMAMFSERGFSLFKQVYNAANSLPKNGPFHEASAADKASLTDVIQEIIDQGHRVECIEVSSGWMEIHSFEDYKQACSLLARAG